jgi:dipeptidyl aminopeptidase/acylaminoacyl peptidase
MGASYGGYGAMMGLVSDPDLFRCAVNWVGVTDIGLWFDVSWSDITDEAKRYGYRTLIGDPELDAAQFKATSPLQQAARITQPVLMAYGEWDRRVPQVHGEKMRDALKAHNPNVEWVVYEKEGHGWYKVETRLDFWGRVERFLARNLATP